MWVALRAELAYFRPWLLGGLGIAAGVSVLLAVLLRLLGDEGPPFFLIAIFPIIAGMVVSFIAQAYRVEERRSLLLLSTPLTPRQLACVMILLPPCLVGLSAIAAVLMVGLNTLVVGGRELASLPTIAGFAGQFLGYAQLGPLAQEATAARRQRRTRASVLGWLVFGSAIPLLAAFFWDQSAITAFGHLWHLIVLGVVMTMTVALFQGRTDYTR